MLELLELLHFNPQNGDWSSAIVAILFGVIQTITTLSLGIFGFYKWKKEASLQKRDRQESINTEKDENFYKNIQWYFNLVQNLEEFDPNVLKLNYQDFESIKNKLGNEIIARKLKFTVFQILNVLEIIFIMSKNCKKYETTWKKHFSFIFKNEIFRSAFKKHITEFDSDFAAYANLLIKEYSKEKIDLGNIINSPEIFNKKIKLLQK